MGTWKHGNRRPGPAAALIICTRGVQEPLALSLIPLLSQVPPMRTVRKARNPTSSCSGARVGPGGHRLFMCPSHSNTTSSLRLIQTTCRSFLLVSDR